MVQKSRSSKPFRSIQSLCAFRLPTVLTLPISAAPPLCHLPLPLPLTHPLGSLLLLDAPIRACVYCALHLMDTRDSICFEPQISSRSNRAPWQMHTHTATAKEPQVESPQHTHLTLKNHPGSEGPTRYHTSALVKTATKAGGRATQPRGPPDN